MPFFYPESQDVNDWIVAFEVITQRKDGQRVEYLPTVLKNKALSWYASEHRTLNGHQRTWEEWREGLKNEFGRSSMAILNELVNRCQKDGESPQDYYQSMITLCSLANSNMTEVEKVSHLLRGLNPPIREKIVLMCPTSAKDFLDKLNRLNVVMPSSQCDQNNVVELLAKALADKQNPEPSLLNVDDKEMSFFKKELRNLSQRMDQLCQAQDSNRSRQRRDYTQIEERSCHYCGIQGHLMRDCRKRRNNQFKSSGYQRRSEIQSSPGRGRQENGRGRW